MNKARREACKKLINPMTSPKEAYDKIKETKELYAHAVWVNGALVRKSKVVSK